jgi:hypothetical protein
MTQSTFFATFLGSLVIEAFASGNKGSIMGLSSKGIFLRVGDYVLFITDAPYKSPFNIYVPGFPRLMEALKQGERFELLIDSINFLDSGTKILTENAETWSPYPPRSIASTLHARIQRAKQLLDDIARIDPRKGWIFLHHSANQPEINADPSHQHIIEKTSEFIAGFKNEDLARCLGAAESLLGLGGGLTPSGDDWLTGFFLYFERLNQASNTRNDFLQALGNKIETLAFQKTTTISANRILAARRGWAEEPFLDVIDTLFSIEGQFNPGTPELLARFGHSSGVDTTLGISAAIDCE